MTKKRIISALTLVSFALLFSGGCYKGTTLDLTSDLEITGDVTFAVNVAPILEKSCALSGCHNANGISPDLSAGKSYNSLVSGQYVDVASPEQSLVYQFVSGNRTPVMPVSGTDPVIAATILAWIQQGAQNN